MRPPTSPTTVTTSRSTPSTAYATRRSAARPLTPSTAFPGSDLDGSLITDAASNFSDDSYYKSLDTFYSLRNSAISGAATHAINGISGLRSRWLADHRCGLQLLRRQLLQVARHLLQPTQLGDQRRGHSRHQRHFRARF